LVLLIVFFSSRRRHTRFSRDWSSDVCSSDLAPAAPTRPAGAARVPAPALPLDRLAPLADVMGTWPGMQDAPGRTHFASVLEHQLGRRIDLRGGRLREDAVTLLRAAAGAPDALREVVPRAALFERAEKATEFEQLIDDLP